MKLRRLLIAAVIIYIFLLTGPIAGFDVPAVAGTIVNKSNLVLRYVTIGIANGGIFAIIALGYTMVYGIIQLINFAHGDLYMMCTFASLTVIAALGTTGKSDPAQIFFTIFIALIVAVLFGAVVNTAIERVAYRRLRNAPRLAPLISAIGVSFILENLGQIWAGQGYIKFLTPYFGTSGGAAQKAYPDLLQNKDFFKDFLGLQSAGVDFIKGREMTVIVVAIILMLIVRWIINKTRWGNSLRSAAETRRVNLEQLVLIIFGAVCVLAFASAILNGALVSVKEVVVTAVAILLMIGLRWFIANTRLGKAMRATSENRDAAKIMGIDIDRIISITFFIGGGLAGAAAVLNGLYVNTAWWLMGFQAGLRSFTAAVLGGIGNVTGAMLGGFMIGILTSLSDGLFDPAWTRVWVFSVLVLVLVFRPTGLFGESVGQKA